MNILYVNPVAFDLFGKPIYWYGIIISFTIFVGYFLADREAKKQGFPKDILLDYILIAVPVAIICARMYYVLFRLDYYLENKHKIIAIWDGGIAIYGGIIGGLITLIIFAKKKSLNLIKMMDIIAPSLLIGQVLGRWGNFFNHEAYGNIVTKEYLENQFIPNFIIENMYINNAYHQPTFLYESLWCLIAFIILIVIRKYLYSGEVVSSYLILYGLERFFVEGLRSDSLYLGNFRISQIVSFCMVVVGISVIVKIRFFMKNKNKYYSFS